MKMLFLFDDIGDIFSCWSRKNIAVFALDPIYCS